MNTIFEQMLAGYGNLPEGELWNAQYEVAQQDETDVYNLSFKTEKGIKIKIEIDTKPPLEFQNRI